MSAIVSSSLDIAELARGIPALIYEKNIENQMVNIKKWLKPFIPINGIGLSIPGRNNDEDHIFSINIQEQAIREVERHFTEQKNSNRDQSSNGLLLFALHDETPVISAPSESELPSGFNGLAIRLNDQDTILGTFFLVADTGVVAGISSDEALLQWFSSILSSLLYNAWSHHQNQENMRLFALYETVSSSLCYAGDLQELLTTIISIIVTELPSEEGSILLFDNETNELEFFSAMGETGSGFVQCRFPADKGIAGKAIQEGLPVIANDVQTCPYFFGGFDNESGFVTKSILAAPIIAGEEKVGVIEAINKVGESGFGDKDKKLLLAIADEVGLAVKNARMFDYVVNSYCKIRQGQMSCKGCVRPLKSWTPCARQLDLL